MVRFHSRVTFWIIWIIFCQLVVRCNIIFFIIKSKNGKLTTPTGLEPARRNSKRFLISRLNHSATVSLTCQLYNKCNPSISANPYIYIYYIHTLSKWASTTTLCWDIAYLFKEAGHPSCAVWFAVPCSLPAAVKITNKHHHLHLAYHYHCNTSHKTHWSTHWCCWFVTFY